MPRYASVAGLALVVAVARAYAPAGAPQTRRPASVRVDAKMGAKKKGAKRGARLQELRDLGEDGAGATKDWAATITQRLDAAATSVEMRECEEKLVDACGDSTRDLAAIDGLVGALGAMAQAPASDAPALAAGDWKLVWARSDDGVCAVGTGLHKVPLANLEEVFLSIGPKKIVTTEVIRVLGPFPNVKNLLSGSASMKKGKVLFSYDTCIDGTGAELSGSQTRDVAFDVASLSRDLLVLCASTVGADEWLVFEREPDLAGTLASCRVSPNDDDDDDEA